MKKQFDILRKTRELTLKFISNLTLEQLHVIPVGFKNNIAWNLTHLLVTQQLLHYRMSGNDCLISEEMIQDFRKGTTPTYSLSEEELKKIKEDFLALPNRLEKDYNTDLFKSYKEYETSTGFVIDSMDTAIQFNNFHESLHLGIIMSLLKLV